MTIGVITNKDKDPALAYTHQVCAFLAGQGIAVTLDDEGLKKAQLWVVLGGDGTMLRCSNIAAQYGIPLFGINLGNLGFLTDVEAHDGIQALTKIIVGNYKIEKRLMLEVLASGINHKLALNDVYITSIGLGKFSIYVNGQELDIVRADGIITATPTGSTAYNLSAGGPILIPTGDMMVITPVCPHSLSTRPCVVGAKDMVEITVHQPSQIILDGEKAGDIAAGGSLVLQKSEYHTKIIKTHMAQLQKILRKKI